MCKYGSLNGTKILTSPLNNIYNPLPAILNQDGGPDVRLSGLSKQRIKRELDSTFSLNVSYEVVESRYSTQQVFEAKVVQYFWKSTSSYCTWNCVHFFYSLSLASHALSMRSQSAFVSYIDRKVHSSSVFQSFQCKSSFILYLKF